MASHLLEMASTLVAIPSVCLGLDGLIFQDCHCDTNHLISEAPEPGRAPIHILG